MKVLPSFWGGYLAWLLLLATTMSDHFSNSLILSGLHEYQAWSRPNHAYNDTMISTTIPTLKGCTHNLNGLHPGARRPAAYKRKAANVKALVSSHDFTFFQELKLSHTGAGYLASIVPPSFREHVYTSVSTAGSGGVGIVLAPEVGEHYKARTIHLPNSLRGSIIALRLVPRDTTTGAPDLVLVNVYIAAGDRYARKTQQLQLLREHLMPSDFLIMGGDFNFVEDKHSDTASASKYYDTTAKFRKEWDRLRDHFSLKEVHQGMHTYFEIDSALSTASSSRLDRFYISYSEADWAATSPSAYIANMPYTLLHSAYTATIGGTGLLSILEDMRDGHERKVGIPDHLPLTLSFKPTTAPAETRGPSIPRWVAEDTSFTALFEARWQAMTLSLDPDAPFIVQDCFKQCLYDAAADVRKARRGKAQAYSSEVGELTCMVKALHCHRAPRSEASVSFFEAHHDLRDRTFVRRRIAQLLEKAEVEPPLSGREQPPSPRTLDPLSKLRPHIPSTRSRLPGLRPDLDSELVTDPDGVPVAELAAGCWSSIWAARPKAECIEPEAYYGSFQRVIPESLMPKLPTVKQVMEAISHSNNSCAGPDGVSFAA